MNGGSVCLKEQLPEQIDPYLVFRIENPYPTARLWKDGDWTSSACITYWAPSPELPFDR